MTSKRGNEKDKIKDDKSLGTEISILNTPHSLSFETDQTKRIKRRRVSSSDRYISQLSPSTKIQYINDCKIISNGILPVSQQTSPLIADRSSSPGANSVNSTNLASSNFFNTPSKSNPSKSYFPSPPSTGMSMKRLTRTFHQSTPSKKHESVMKDLERIAMANPSLFYASQKNSSAGIKQRIQDIAKTPEMVLDAPNFRDDYYTTLLSWGPNGNMLVGLNDECFLWNQDGLLSKVYQATRPDYIVSVDFCPTGSLAAIGTDDGNIKIFNLDLSDEIPQHSLYMPQLSILKWKNEQTLLTGFADGILRIYDIRNLTRPSSILSGYHDDKICGLARAGNSHLFSVGGNEGIVTVWDDRKLNAPVWNITSHSSAVRAMKWCPWASYILATGGGLDDESIQFHSTDSGKDFYFTEFLRKITKNFTNW